MKVNNIKEAFRTIILLPWSCNQDSMSGYVNLVIVLTHRRLKCFFQCDTTSCEFGLSRFVASRVCRLDQ